MIPKFRRQSQVEKFQKWNGNWRFILQNIKINFWDWNFFFKLKPFELAIKENNTAAVNILGSQVGTDMINTYLKTKQADIRPWDLSHMFAHTLTHFEFTLEGSKCVKFPFDICFFFIY